tara:strand:- start:279 stop:536 length:258 start_codon:yes stop_codon:yes gene_type:complete
LNTITRKSLILLWTIKRLLSKLKYKKLKIWNSSPILGKVINTRSEDIDYISNIKQARYSRALPFRQSKNWRCQKQNNSNIPSNPC